MKIFDYENFNLVLNMPEILLVKEFKAVVDSDKSSEKEKAFKMFQYCYLVCDWQSPYKDYTEEQRQEASQRDSTLSDKDIESDLVQSCIEKYLEILNNNKTIRLIESMSKSVDKFMKYFENIDFTEVVESGARKGTLLHSPKEYLDVMKKSKEIFESLKYLREVAKEEMEQEADDVRGDRDKGFFNQ